MAAAAYFGVAAFFVLACFFLYALVLPRLPIIRAQQRAARGVHGDGSDLAIGHQARCSALALQSTDLQAVPLVNIVSGVSVIGQQRLQHAQPPGALAA